PALRAFQFRCARSPPNPAWFPEDLSEWHKDFPLRCAQTALTPRVRPYRFFRFAPDRADFLSQTLPRIRRRVFRTPKDRRANCRRAGSRRLFLPRTHRRQIARANATFVYRDQLALRPLCSEWWVQLPSVFL